MNFRTYIFLLALIILTGVSDVAPCQKEYELDSLSEYIEQSRKLFGVPGLSVGIIKDGEIVFNKGFGLKNADSGDEVAPSTVFGIASCTKAFTAACLAILADEGKIKWSDRVTDHYPDFKLADSCATAEMQIKDLICHRSGLQTFDGDLLWYGSNYTREEVMKRIQYRELSYSFRSTFGYQNVMYIAAGQLIQAVTGLTWDEFLKDRIFDPLDMNSSSTSNRDIKESMKVAVPHVDGKPLEFLSYDNCGPAASINSSAEDLLKWVTLLLNKGANGENQIFSQEEYYNLVQPMTLLNAGKAEQKYGTHFYTYGLGWFMFDLNGRKVIQHGGGLPGFHSKVAFIPEENLGFVILANQLSGLVEAIYRRILDFYLDENQQDWAQQYLENQKNREEEKEIKEKERIDSRKEGTSPTLKLESYTGIYEDKMYGEAKIEKLNGHLNITLLPTSSLFFSKLEHWENDTFKITFNDLFLPSGYITFNLNEDNTVNNFTIDLENPDFHFYKLNFTKKK